MFNPCEISIKNPRNLLVATLVATFARGVGVRTLAANTEQFGLGEPIRRVANQGRKWAADEPRRDNMNEIRPALAAIQADSLKYGDARGPQSARHLGRSPHRQHSRRVQARTVR